MLKSISTIFLLCVVTLGIVLSGCSGGGGSQGSATSSPTSDPAITGAATADSLVAGTVTLKDSSVPVQARKTTISSDGTYTFITTGLVEPYILKAEWTDTSGSSNKMYSMAAAQPGNTQPRDVSTADRRANINPLSDVIVAASADGGSADDLFDHPDPSRYQNTSYNLAAVINSLRTVLAPLFALYQASGNPITDDNEDNNSGLRAMLRDVRFVVNSGTVTVTNRQTGGVIFSGPLNDLASGTFHPENMPAGSGGSTACTSFTYSAWGACQSDNTQTRTIATSSPTGCTGGTPDALSQSCTYVPQAPSPCTYNYSNWGACQSDGTQTRTVLQSTPVSCTGTPALSQTCTYVPPATTCTSFTYSAWGACQSDSTQTRTVATSTPAGCTGGTPAALSQTCTYVPPVTTCTSFTYSAWGACQSDSTQTRTVATSTPAGCTGGTPAALSQTCTYVPPVTTCTSFTYSAWGTCQSNGTQARTVATSSPAGCTGGTPVLSQSCTPTSTVTLANVSSSCTGCHGLTVNTTVFASGGYSISGRSASSWLSTINTMVGYGASLAPGTTATDYANFMAGLP